MIFTSLVLIVYFPIPLFLLENGESCKHFLKMGNQSLIATYIYNFYMLLLPPLWLRLCKLILLWKWKIIIIIIFNISIIELSKFKKYYDCNYLFQEMLNQSCPTPDCNSIIVRLIICRPGYKLKEVTSIYLLYFLVLVSMLNLLELMKGCTQQIFEMGWGFLIATSKWNLIKKWRSSKKAKCMECDLFAYFPSLSNSDSCITIVHYMWMSLLCAVHLNVK